MGERVLGESLNHFDRSKSSRKLLVIIYEIKNNEVTPYYQLKNVD